MLNSLAFCNTSFTLLELLCRCLRKLRCLCSCPACCVCCLYWTLALSKCHLQNSIALWFCFVYFHKVFSSRKVPEPAIKPSLSLSLSLKATPMAGGRRKSIWHRLLLLIFRCVLFSVKIKLLICAFVCVDLDRFASFRWLKRRPLPHPHQKETQTRTWARGGRKLFSGPSTNTHKKHFGSPFWRCLFVCLLACLFLYVGLFYG